ncbi:hypothetical protein BDK51DRAFT_29795 [Blyttiomyces helicus]|uniref:Uncharacterized protein n=1 Tax=Blyttiomyces helicus TaxID=388810 RepID=A0A4P9WPE0_9FUNG|nr:hypothetical protein BDK51DRAFT_29795 [Blyttiomyces helicus]|eukprot:RKO94185.1 hypothetical protein BDK51DRAFT_29795 [Blyttiomyces helicus]
MTTFSVPEFAYENHHLLLTLVTFAGHENARGFWAPALVLRLDLASSASSAVSPMPEASAPSASLKTKAVRAATHASCRDCRRERLSRELVQYRDRCKGYPSFAHQSPTLCLLEFWEGRKSKTFDRDRKGGSAPKRLTAIRLQIWGCGHVAGGGDRGMLESFGRAQEAPSTSHLLGDPAWAIFSGRPRREH